MLFSDAQISNLLSFPRPDFRRVYQLLDGKWRLMRCSSISNAQRVIATNDFSDAAEVTVPFCLESAASGNKHSSTSWHVLYQTTFRKPSFPAADSYLLHLGAVDHDCCIYLNGKLLATNSCGYNQITIQLQPDALIPENNTLIVQVRDSRAPTFLRGKQSIFKTNRFVFYTPASGIWQSVWLEPVGVQYLTDVKATTMNQECLLELGFTSGPVDFELSLEVDGETHRYRKADCTQLGSIRSACLRFTLTLPLTLFSDCRGLWSPENPALHPLRITTFTDSGQGLRQCDAVESQIGVRTVSWDRGSLYLNGQPFYQRLLLHQGYYPEGWYRPVDKNMYLTDLQLIKAAGFNGVRMHQKVEDPAFLFCADALGMAVWGEFPSCYWLNFKARNELRLLLEQTVRRDYNHPSIITWVIFNESWGLFHALKRRRFRQVLEEFYYFLQTLDSTRPIIDNSGFYHVHTDILDVHYYADSLEKFCSYLDSLSSRSLSQFTMRAFLSFLRAPYRRPQPELYDSQFEDKNQPLMLSEFGGYGFYASDRLSLGELYRAWMTELARHPKISGFCYTQFTDVDHEQNGLFTFERRPKLALAQLAELTRLPSLGTSPDSPLRPKSELNRVKDSKNFR